MKILIATMSLGIGGAETHIVELSRELLRRGHEVVVASNGGVYVKELEEAGARHYVVPMHRRSLMDMRRSRKLLGDIIERERPDVVHAHARIPAFICGKLRKKLRFPFVTTAHGVFEVNGLLRRITNWGDRTISVSKDITEYLKDNYGIPESQIIPSVNGIDPERFAPGRSAGTLRAELGIAEGAEVLLHVSRLDEASSKAARGLIAIAPQLAKRIPGAVIVIAGGGDVYDELRELAGETNLKLGYKCVILTGPRTDVPELLGAADAFAGVSRAALEAMAAGLPTVICGSQGYMGVFDEDKLETAVDCNFCGRGCGELKNERLLDDVTTVLTLPLDERERLGEASRRAVLENYSVSRMADDALRAYAEAMDLVHILVSGYYGYGNAGDEAVLASIYGTIREISPGADVSVLSNAPENTAADFGCRAVPRFAPLEVLREIRRCDILISGGGSLIQDKTSTRSLLYYLAVIRLAKIFKKRVMIFANGIGPVDGEGNRRRVKKAVDLADAVTLRDPDSLEELRNMGVTRQDIIVTADPVFTLPLPKIGGVREILTSCGVPEGAYVVVSVRPWDVENGFYESFARICDGIALKHDLRVVFIEMQPALDENMSREVMSLMEAPAYLIPGKHSSAELMGIIGGASLVLSMRLHALIFAACMATPAMGFVYDPKVQSYLELLSQPSAGSTGKLDVNAVLRAADIIFHHKEELELRLEDRRQELLELASGNARVLGELIGSVTRKK